MATAETLASLSEEERTLLESVDKFLAHGIALKTWWEQAEANNGFSEEFDLVHTYRRPERTVGFFGDAPVNGTTMPVMGVVDEVFYDRPKGAEDVKSASANWMKDQIREFVLKYFMRISDFRLPEEYIAPNGHSSSTLLDALSMLPKEEIHRKGMGFQQVFYKNRATGDIEKFSEAESTHIVDLREIGDTYDWIVVKLRVYDFNVTVKPLGTDGPQMTMPMKEEGYLILTPDFICNQENPEEGVLGRYGFGYAFIKNPTRGMFAYGPGEFEAAFQTITFEVRDTGETNVRMAFVSDQPEKVMNLTIDPVEWGFSLADMLSFGMTSKLLSPVKDALDRLPLRGENLDPTLPSISLLNQVTGGQASKQLAINREQLFKGFLVKHSMQHYQTLLGSLRSWRQIPDWQDEDSLPEWVKTGQSS